MNNTENAHKPGACLDPFCNRCYADHFRTRCGIGHPIFTRACTLHRGHSGYHGDGDISWADPATQRDGTRPIRHDYPAISRCTILEVCEALGLDGNDTDRIVILADSVTVYGKPGTVPLVLPVVGE